MSSCLINLKSECTSFIFSDSILVIGGSGDGGRKDTVELLSLETESRTLGSFPKQIVGAVGTMLGEFLKSTISSPPLELKIIKHLKYISFAN